MKKFLAKFLDVTGIRRNSKYVKDHLDEANLRSGIYMAAILIIIEAWMIIRRLIEDVPERISNRGEDFFTAFFRTSSNFFLLISMGLAMFAYCAFSIDKRKTKKKAITVIALSSLCFIFGALLPCERFYGDISDTLKIVFYMSVIAFGAATIFATVYTYWMKGKTYWLKARIVVITFAFVCLVFGIYVSYSDFFSEKSLAAGEYKQIICFLMMAMYVACLLIWKPYVSLGILGASSLFFYFMLKSNETTRRFPDGDLVNYITFFISLTMICFSIYNQRVDVAKNSEQLQILASTDTLTGLMSFDYFLSSVRETCDIENVKADERIFLFINLRSFKLVNDQRGFEAGNKFLINAGKIIQESFPDAFVSRQSDDHFVVFIKNENILESIEAANKRICDLDPEIKITIAVGGYLFDSLDEDMQRCIDKARYACYTLINPAILYQEYDQNMHDEYHLMQYIIRNVDTAVREGWVKAYYQPVVWADTGKLCGLEALARWEDPKHGFLNPAKFVPALEQSLLIHKLDAAIIEIVCRDIRRRIDDGIPNLPVSINFSRLDFQLMDAVEVLDQIVTKYRVPKELLHVEITESALMDDDNLLHDAVNRLHEKGYALWLDDFGSGYSSLNVLKDYAFDVLKIDMKFLSGFETNEKAKALITSIITMAESIGMRTLTEGVESKEQAEFLKSVFCGRLQGYLYSKPIRYDELLQKIARKELVIADHFD